MNSGIEKMYFRRRNFGFKVDRRIKVIGRIQKYIQRFLSTCPNHKNIIQKLEVTHWNLFNVANKDFSISAIKILAYFGAILVPIAVSET